jgi:hypothetical protein
MKCKWLDRRLIENPYYVGLCTDEKSFRRELKRLGIPKDEIPTWLRDTADATVHELAYKGKQCAIVCIRKSRRHTRVEIDGLLIHEAVHVWQWIKGVIREDKPSPEFEAYAIQRLAMNLMSAYHAG